MWSGTQTERSKSSLLLLSAKLVLLSSASSQSYTSSLHLLHTYLTTLSRYDPSWSIRDLTRFYVSLLYEAGIQIQTANGEESSDDKVHEAFARGDLLDLNITGEREQRNGEAERDLGMQESLRKVLLARDRFQEASPGQ